MCVSHDFYKSVLTPCHRLELKQKKFHFVQTVCKAWLIARGLDYYEFSLSKSILVYKHFQTCLQISWQQATGPWDAMLENRCQLTWNSSWIFLSNQGSRTETISVSGGNFNILWGYPSGNLFIHNLHFSCSVILFAMLCAKFQNNWSTEKYLLVMEISQDIILKCVPEGYEISRYWNSCFTNFPWSITTMLIKVSE